MKSYLNNIQVIPFLISLPVPLLATMAANRLDSVHFACSVIYWSLANHTDFCYRLPVFTTAHPHWILPRFWSYSQSICPNRRWSSLIFIADKCSSSLILSVDYWSSSLILSAYYMSSSLILSADYRSSSLNLSADYWSSSLISFIRTYQWSKLCWSLLIFRTEKTYDIE